MHTKISRPTLAEKVEAAREFMEIVSSTMGPGGRPFALSGTFQDISKLIKNQVDQYRVDDKLINRDGVTLAMVTTPKDPYKSMVAKVMREAAREVLREVGDGTTTSIVLTWAILNAVKEQIDSLALGDINYYDIQSGIYAAVEDIIAKVEASSDKEVTKGKLISIATISSNGNKEFGTTIGKLVHNVSRDGSISIHESMTGETYTEVDQGYSFPLLPRQNDYLGNSDCLELDNPLFALIEKPIESYEQLKPVLDAWHGKYSKTVMLDNGRRVSTYERPLVIYTETIKGAAFATLLLNWRNNNVPVFVLRPQVGLDPFMRFEILKDMKGVTDTDNIFSDLAGSNIEKFGGDYPPGNAYKEFGTAKKAYIYKDRILVTLSEEEKESRISWINDRVDHLRAEAKKESNPHLATAINHRVARLACGFGRIYVHGNSDTELDYNKSVADDAYKAALHAYDGISAGGGATLLVSSYHIKEQEEDSYGVGYTALHLACSKPLEILCKRLNKNPDDAIGALIGSMMNRSGMVYDFKVGGLRHMTECGIVDPTKLVCATLRKSASVACQILLHDVFLNIVKD
jgi:chaperonin GroEL